MRELKTARQQLVKQQTAEQHASKEFKDTCTSTEGHADADLADLPAEVHNLKQQLADTNAALAHSQLQICQVGTISAAAEQPLNHSLHQQHELQQESQQASLDTRTCELSDQAVQTNDLCCSTSGNNTAHEHLQQLQALQDELEQQHLQAAKQQGLLQRKLKKHEKASRILLAENRRLKLQLGQFQGAMAGAIGRREILTTLRRHVSGVLRWWGMGL